MIETGLDIPLSPSDIYTLEKIVWTHDDFDRMGWHDVPIHAVKFVPGEDEFVLDIDYIFAWVNPEPPSPGYSFWIAPSTLVFRDTTNFRAEFGDSIELEIMEVTRENPRPPKNVDCIDSKIEWTWTIVLARGEITFSSTGFFQYTRKNPIRIGSQYLSDEYRGGKSFERTDKLIELQNEK